MLQIPNDDTIPAVRRGADDELPVFAALDLGTNNCRLLIASPKNGGIRVFDSFSRVVRLGEGVSNTGVLSDEAMERTLIALKACQRKLEKYELAGYRFVATEACRRAENGMDFLALVTAETGMKINIITTEDEASLAFAGCASLLTGDAKQAVVFDIGGGSTELMWVDIENGKTIIDWLSVGYGVMNLSDKFGGANLADIAFYDMVEALRSRLKDFDKINQINEAIKRGTVQLLSTSGTATTLAAIHLGLPRYERNRIDGITLGVADIRAVIQKLLNMRPSQRFNQPCIGAERADFILSGCAIFEAIGGMWQTENITIADRGVREGIILSLAEELKK